MSEKTEKPTPKKLRDARRKGEVSSSKDVIFSLLMMAMFVFIALTSGFYYRKLSELILLPASFIGGPLAFEDRLREVLQGGFMLLVQMSLPVMALVILVGIAAHLMQFGVLFAFESLKPSLKKINPAEGIKKIFSLKNLIELIKSVIKIVFLAILLLITIRNHIADLIKIPDCGLVCIQPVLGAMMLDLAISTSIAFIVIAGADFAFQKFQFTKRLRMSKHEVKQEYKEMEGDPFIKSKRRQLHQELQQQNMVNSVKKSTLVVTNPTHIAVALEYREGQTPLPILRAKGENLLARRIIDIARQEGIPIMENVPLARALQEQGGIDEYIPSDLIEAVAEVLRWVGDLEAR